MSWEKFERRISLSRTVGAPLLVFIIAEAGYDQRSGKSMSQTHAAFPEWGREIRLQTSVLYLRGRNYLMMSNYGSDEKPSVHRRRHGFCGDCLHHDFWRASCTGAARAFAARQY